MSRLLVLLFLVSSLCCAQGFADGFDHGTCDMTAVRSNLGITISPPQGASDLKMRMVVDGLPVRKGEVLTGALIGQAGSPPYVYSIVSGSLPTGVSLDTATGLLSGTPTVVGFYPFLAEVQDSALGAFTCRFAINVIPPFVVTAGSPSDGEKDSIYSYAFAVSGATGSVTWAISPSLVITHGLYLHTATGVLDTTDLGGGTGAIIGSSDLLVNFTITATDSGSGDSLTIPCSIYIWPALDTPNITPGYNVVVGISTLLSDSGYFGGKPPFKLALTSSLPSGLTIAFNPNDYTATVLAAEPFDLTTVQFVVTDSLGGAVPAAFDLTASAVNLDGTLSANSDSLFPTQKAVKTYVDAIAASLVGLLDYKGATDCSANPNYPAALKGDTYVVSVAGKIGGASGTSVDAGDWYICEADNAGGTEASVGTSWGHVEHNLVGALLAANNLSDVASAVAALDNLTKHGADIASASTTNIASATGRNVNVTGTTTITALGTAADGIERVTRFTGDLVLTHNATSLICLTGANITTVAGDECGWLSLGSGNWRMQWYARADGSALAGGSGGTDFVIYTLSGGTL
jgi:hypothetical protein